MNAERQVCKGVLVMALNLVADVAGKPSDHTAHFIGDRPCSSQGRPLEDHQQQQPNTLLPGLVVNHYFSAKLRGSDYADYYQKVSIYVSMLAGQAQAIDPSVTAKTFAPIRSETEDTVFAYTDTASPRAGIAMPTQNFKGLKIAIVGLGAPVLTFWIKSRKRQWQRFTFTMAICSSSTTRFATQALSRSPHWAGPEKGGVFSTRYTARCIVGSLNTR